MWWLSQRDSISHYNRVEIHFDCKPEHKMRQLIRLTWEPCFLFCNTQCFPHFSIVRAPPPHRRNSQSCPVCSAPHSECSDVATVNNWTNLSRPKPPSRLRTKSSPKFYVVSYLWSVELFLSQHSVMPTNAQSIKSTKNIVVLNIKHQRTDIATSVRTIRSLNCIRALRFLVYLIKLCRSF